MPSNRWKEFDGRRARCPLCRLYIPVGTLRGHVGSVRCLSVVGGSRRPLTEAQRALVDQGKAYEEAIRAEMRVQAEVDASAPVGAEGSKGRQ